MNVGESAPTLKISNHFGLPNSNIDNFSTQHTSNSNSLAMDMLSASDLLHQESYFQGKPHESMNPCISMGQSHYSIHHGSYSVNHQPNMFSMIAEDQPPQMISNDNYVPWMMSSSDEIKINSRYLMEDCQMDGIGNVGPCVVQNVNGLPHNIKYIDESNGHSICGMSSIDNILKDIGQISMEYSTIEKLESSQDMNSEGGIENILLEQKVLDYEEHKPNEKNEMAII
mmetsp:Transcript_6881/g.10321  ORF Transcript_6881/g.10321 Transcript_6881/m.10321 type:complete len:227 (+) Transcript_6881:430-1110(+)